MGTFSFFLEWSGLTNISVAIPVKKLSESKTRLSSILSLEKREELVRRMLIDVLNAVTQSSMINQIMIVCSDKTVLKDNHCSKIRIIEDETYGGLNFALKGAVDYSVRCGADSLLILPADIPLIQKSDVELIIRSSSDHGIVIIPSKDRLGTNALMLTPPNVIPTAFGSNSFLSHLRLAKACGTPVNILRIERVSLDIDTAEHIREFLSFSTHSNTRDYLFKIDLVELQRRSQF
jgi:2-phospho-L-lactate guanylyltransferase